MSAELIHDALNYIDDGLIEKTNLLRQGRRTANPMWLRWGTLAACLCLIFVGAWTMMRHGFGGSTDQAVPMEMAANEAAAGQFSGTSDDGAAADLESPAEPEAPAARAEDTSETGASASRTEESMCADPKLGVTIPKMEVNLYDDPEIEADMLAFFIYGGRSYVQYELIEDAEALVGDYVAAATGLIDEWTEEDGYVELAGSVSGNFYTVTGYDPVFMLCMRLDNGTVQTFINDNGITLSHGSELFEDRLHLAGNFDTVEYETYDSWKQGRNEIGTLPADTLDSFITAINEADFMEFDNSLLSAQALDPTYRGDDEMERYVVYLHKNDGTTVTLRLFEGGYVQFMGLHTVCVQIDEVLFEELTVLMKEG